MATRLTTKRKLKQVTITIDKETFEEVEEITKEFPSLNRTEIIRYAVEYAISIKIKEFKTLLGEVA
jgi:metal-responsive CopG/Arc/MetJ family transcriptional regulator